MIGEQEVLAFRQSYYDVLVRLLWREPTRELLEALAPGVEERSRGARPVHPLLGEGWGEVDRFLRGGSPDELVEAVADEYMRLFIGGPLGGAAVNPYESYYLTGYFWDRPLVVVRDFLKEVGIEKEEGFPEPEDSLVFELEVMRRLIGRQYSAPDPDGQARWLNAQASFLKRHLLVWAPAAAKDLAEAAGAVFYGGVGKLLQGFLELEQKLFEGWGSEEVRSLEEARRSFGQLGQWRGPLFDFPGDSTPAGGEPEA